MGSNESDKEPLAAVYAPPEPGYPFLAAVILPDGRVMATSHTTVEDAEAQVLKRLSEAHEELGKD